MTDRRFQDMLNDYLPNTLLEEELIKRDFILQKVQKDNNWKGGQIAVPFKGARASSISFGSLTAANDIAQSTKVRGTIDNYREVWGTLIFNHTDLMQHDGPVPESSFITLMDDDLDDHMQFFKEAVSVQFGSGPHFALVTDSTNAATGIFIVDRVERYELDQKCTLDDDNSAATDVYVIAINVNTNAVTFSATRGGAAADLSAYTAAQNAKFYHPGVFDAAGNHNTFISMRQVLLSAANGGTATVHGKSKVAYPYLQAVNISGASITAANILDSLFLAYLEVQKKCKGMATDFLMSYKHWGSCMMAMEIHQGAYKVVGDPKRSMYGWTEVTIAQAKSGQALNIVAIQEMDDDIIPIIDWSTITFRTNGSFRKRKSPDGNEYFEVRNTTGYAYIVDTCLFGEMEYRKPGHCAVIYGIPAY